MEAARAGGAPADPSRGIGPRPFGSGPVRASWLIIVMLLRSDGGQTPTPPRAPSSVSAPSHPQPPPSLSCGDQSAPDAVSRPRGSHAPEVTTA